MTLGQGHECPWVMENNCVIYCQDPTWQELWPRCRFSVCVHCDIDLGSRPWQALGQGQQLCELLSRSNLTVRSKCQDKDIGYMCTLTLEIWPWDKVMTHPLVMDNDSANYESDPTWHAVRSYGLDTDFGYVWPWPGRYDLWSRSSLTLGLWTTIVWNIIHIQLDSEELWSSHGFWVYVHCDFDLGYIDQGQDSPFGHGQQLCEILFSSTMTGVMAPVQIWVCVHCDLDLRDMTLIPSLRYDKISNSVTFFVWSIRHL